MTTSRRSAGVLEDETEPTTLLKNGAKRWKQPWATRPWIQSRCALSRERGSGKIELQPDPVTMVPYSACQVMNEFLIRLLPLSNPRRRLLRSTTYAPA